jgi:hypothetical protein
MALGLAVAVAALVLGWLLAGRSEERGVYLAALALKIAACVAYCAIYWFVYEGEGDSIDRYHVEGIEYAERLRTGEPPDDESPPPVLDVFLPLGSSTSRMVALTGLLHVLLFDSFLATSLVFALLGFAGQVLLYRTFAERFPLPALRPWLRTGILFWPGVVFWSAGILKEPVGLFGLGCALWGLHRLLRESSWASVALVGVGLYVLMLYRLQVAGAMMIALAPLMREPPQRAGVPAGRPPTGPGPLLIRLGLPACCVAGLILVSFLEPDYAVEKLPETVAYESNAYATYKHEGELLTDASWAALAAQAPAALFFTLFRPLPWELAGVLQTVSGLENLALLGLTAWALLSVVRRPAAFGAAVRMPIFQACLLFVVLYGTVVGLSTPNLGTVSRYRIPLIPFLTGLFVAIKYQALVRARGEAGERLPLVAA